MACYLTLGTEEVTYYQKGVPTRLPSLTHSLLIKGCRHVHEETAWADKEMVHDMGVGMFMLLLKAIRLNISFGFVWLIGKIL